MKTLLSLLLTLVLSCPAVHAATEAETIKAARRAQNAAIAAFKPDEVASFWTDDVTICRGLGVLVAGKAAYRKLFETDAASPAVIVYQREPETVDVSPHWPLAFETGFWRGHQGGVDGPTIISGRYSAQWVKRDGRWLIRAEVYVALDGTGDGLKAKAAP